MYMLIAVRIVNTMMMSAEVTGLGQHFKDK